MSRRKPAPLMRALLGLALIAGLLVWVTEGTGFHASVSALAVMVGIGVAGAGLAQTRKESASLFATSISRALTVGTLGSVLTFLAVLTHNFQSGWDYVVGASAVVVMVALKVVPLALLWHGLAVLAIVGLGAQVSTDAWVYLAGAGTVASVVGLGLAWRPLAAKLSSPFRLPWIAIAVSLLVGAAASLLGILDAKTDAVALEGALGGLWTGLAVAAGWLFLSSAWGWWHLARNRPLTTPRYRYPEGASESELLANGADFLLTALLTNLRDFGGKAFAVRLCSALQEMAQSQGLAPVIKHTDEAIAFACQPTEDLGVEELATKLRDAACEPLAEGVDVAGRQGIQRILATILKYLPWEERDLIRRHVYGGTTWQTTIGETKAIAPAERAGVLHRTFLFHQFADDELSRLASIVDSRTYSQGEYVTQQDQEGYEAYVIQRGTAEVLVEDEVGETRAVAILGAGDFFGEMALLEEAPRSASVRALQELEVLVLDRPVFDRFVDDYGLKLLRKTFHVEQLDEEELRQMAPSVVTRQYAEGEAVIRMREPGHEAYVIRSGAAEVLVEGRGGKVTPVATIGPRDLFGEMALLEDAPRTATVRATEDLEVLVLDRQAFAQFLEKYGGVREKLTGSIQALRFIQRMPLFEEFSKDEVAALAPKFRLQRAAANEAIMSQGELGDRFYIIQEGAAEVIVEDEGERKTIKTLGSGDYCGEIALLLDTPRTATVRATQPMTLFALDRADFLEMLGGDPYVSTRLREETERRTEELKQFGR